MKILKTASYKKIAQVGKNTEAACPKCEGEPVHIDLNSSARPGESSYKCLDCGNVFNQ